MLPGLTLEDAGRRRADPSLSGSGQNCAATGTSCRGVRNSGECGGVYCVAFSFLVSFSPGSLRAPSRLPMKARPGTTR